MHDKPLHKRLIALDYDDTFSLAPEAWAASMAPLKAAGFVIWGVTLRNRHQVIDCAHYKGLCDVILYCAGNGKRALLETIAGGAAVWVDDKPEYIVNTYALIHGQKCDLGDVPACYTPLHVCMKTGDETEFLG